MAKNEVNPSKLGEKSAGHFHAFSGDRHMPEPMDTDFNVTRHATWKSVRDRQQTQQQTFTLDEVKEIVAEAVAAALSSNQRSQQESPTLKVESR